MPKISLPEKDLRWLLQRRKELLEEEERAAVLAALDSAGPDERVRLELLLARAGPRRPS